MKYLIINALNEAWFLFQKRIPQTKTERIYKYAGNIKPIDIADFMTKNNIPNSARLGNNEDGEFCIFYDVEYPTSENEKIIFCKKGFNSVAWKFIYEYLTTNGYKRTGFNSGLLKEFDDTTVYDMYIAKDFDRLCKYYSLSFIKN